MKHSMSQDFLLEILSLEDILVLDVMYFQRKNTCYCLSYLKKGGFIYIFKRKYVY